MLSSHDLSALLPILVVVATALVVLVADWFLDPTDPRPPTGVALVGLVLAGLALLRGGAIGLAFTRSVTLPGGATVASGMVRVDGFGVYAQAALLVVAFLVVLISLDYVRRRGIARAEYFVLVLVATAGMMLLSIANDLILVFLALETFSIALYVLAAFLRGDRLSQEAALKYFILGAFAAGFLLYGTALVYATTSTTNLDAIHASLVGRVATLPALIYVALALLLVGLGFKVAMAPFHQWTPDVYEGAPTPVTAFMATGTKLAAFVVLFRILWTAFPALSAVWVPLLALFAVLTMFVGNLAALVQSDLKRMLAFSAVAQAGYLLVALVVGAPAGSAALLFYLLMYALMTLGAFAVLIGIGQVGAGREATNLNDLAGLGTRHAGLAAALALFLISLTGLPPTAGFLGKWYIFTAAVGTRHIWLAVFLVVNSVLSAFYYLRPVVVMYMVPSEGDETFEVPTAVAVSVATTALVVGLALLLAAPLVNAAASATVARVPSAEVAGQPLFIAAPAVPPPAP